MQKKLKDSKAENAQLQGLLAREGEELLLSGQRQSLLESQATEVESRIRSLEAEVEVLRKNSEEFKVDH